MSKSNIFSKKLLSWYDPNARLLPWKSIKDPYKIWISEIILQQTRAEQAIPYYNNFIKKFPDVDTLANAALDEVIKAWEGLGYYSRARNLHHAAKSIQEEHQSQIPTTYDQLLSLKGIGPYTAAAISSFAFGEPKAVLDGNVYRVLARVFGIEDPINVSASKKVFQHKLNQIFDTKNPALFNQSIMDFGATCCKPKLPSCSSCPMSSFCFALKHNCIHELPKKIKPPKKKVRYLNYLLLRDGNHLMIHQRIQKDIWQNLYQFPLFESKEPATESYVIDNFKRIFSLGDDLAFQNIYSTKRILTHQKLLVEIWETDVKKKDIDEIGDAFWVNLDDLHKFAFPKMFDLFFKQYC